MNECAICFYSMNETRDKLTKCQHCLKCVHTICYRKWSKKLYNTTTDTCLYCQCNGGLHQINLTRWEKFFICCFG